MKRNIHFPMYCVLMMCGCHWCSAAMTPYQRYLLSPWKTGAQAKVYIHVVDQNQKSVSNAYVYAFLHYAEGRYDYQEIIGKTDLNGNFIVEGHVLDRIGFLIYNEGYYQTHDSIRYDTRKQVEAVRDGKWQPYGCDKDIILRQIINPVLRPKKMNKIEIPKYKEWLEFDFERIDWLPPHGKGVYPDVLLRFERTEQDYKNYHVVMDVSWTNQPYAGGYIEDKIKYSTFQTNYEAPTNANYQTEIKIGGCRENGKQIFNNGVGPERYLVFRTRTKVDQNHNLLSACYGRIEGTFMFFRDGKLKIDTLYFNTKDNNLEDLDLAERAREAFQEVIKREKKRLKEQSKTLPAQNI